MAGRRFAIGDVHWRHKPIVDYRERFKTLEEHDNFIVDLINETVGKRDVLYFLGDVCFGGEKYLDLMMDKIICRHNKLALGNHDQMKGEVYQKYFSKVQSSFDIIKRFDVEDENGKRVDKVKAVLSHIPIHPACMDRWAVNIHAHLHNHTVIEDSRYVCSSLEATGYTLIDVDKVLTDIHEMRERQICMMKSNSQ